MNIFLIGLPGAGKSTLGKLAAEKTGRVFVDLDVEIEQLTGLPIKEIFRRHGEEYFRRTEHNMLAAAAQNTGQIISVGGGVILREDNRALLKTGFTVFIDRPTEQILKNLPGDGSRPLLTHKNSLRDLAAERRELYLLSSDTVLESEDNVKSSLKELLTIINGALPGTDMGVIGFPVAHSLSPAIHGLVLKELAPDLRYSAMRVRPEELANFVAKVRGSGMRGFNVTVPHKQTIAALLDGMDEDARRIGAVNTVVCRNGRLKGYNTDARGLSEALIERGRSFSGRNVVILGAGGAASAAAIQAAKENAALIVILARRTEQAVELAEKTAGQTGANISGGVFDSDTPLPAADILLNCTPLGMNGIKDGFRSFGFLESLPASALVCDLIYNPPETGLIKAASARGLATMNGIPMLVNQALLAAELFLERTLDKDRLKRQIKEFFKNL